MNRTGRPTAPDRLVKRELLQVVRQFSDEDFGTWGEPMPESAEWVSVEFDGKLEPRALNRPLINEPKLTSGSRSKISADPFLGKANEVTKRLARSDKHKVP